MKQIGLSEIIPLFFNRKISLTEPDKMLRSMFGRFYLEFRNPKRECLKKTVRGLSKSS